jgi:hypothetical protein
MKHFIIALIILIIPSTVLATSSDQIAKKVINSLKTESHKWRSDAHRLYFFKHPDQFEIVSPYDWDDEADCVIWIANEAYGVKIESPQKVIFGDSYKREIWKIYQMWATDHFANNVFVDPETVTILPEQTIKESDTPLAPVTIQWNDVGSPVLEASSDSTWKIISGLQFAVIILMMGLLFYLKRHKAA